MTEKKSNFMDAVRAAQANKSKVSQSKVAQVQQVKFKNQVSNNKPVKRTAGRGG